MPNEVLKHESIKDWRGGTRYHLEVSRVAGHFIDLSIDGKAVRIDASYFATVISEMAETVEVA
jgi:hypothetical protein